MTIHAHTDQGASCPAYINISERDSYPGDVIVTVRSAGENGASSIILSRDQLAKLVNDASAYLGVSPQQSAGLDVKQMVDRFLGWKLPDTFHPDCFVAFHRETAKQNGSWPSGTNLLNAEEARAMFEHVLQGPAT